MQELNRQIKYWDSVAGRKKFTHLNLKCLTVENMPLGENTFDAAILFAVLTCIPTDKGQYRLINSVLRALKPNGLIHVSDYFLQNDRRNRTRYDTFHRNYGVYGAFELDSGPMLRHHARTWVEALLSPFHRLSMEEMNAPTMNGHPSTIFQYWGRKLRKEI
jgi:SAM-dependent methyltransferase